MFHLSFQNVAPHVQSMLIQAMTEWYLQNDTPDYTRMSRILDVAQDLKVQCVVSGWGRGEGGRLSVHLLLY